MRVQVLELVPSVSEAGWFTLEWPEGEAAPAATGGAAAAAVQGGRADVCLVLHASGTTNKPKIVPLSHEVTLTL